MFKDKRKILFYEGEKAEEFYFILQGEVFILDKKKNFPKNPSISDEELIKHDFLSDDQFLAQFYPDY